MRFFILFIVLVTSSLSSSLMAEPLLWKTSVAFEQLETSRQVVGLVVSGIADGNNYWGITLGRQSYRELRPDSSLAQRSTQDYGLLLMPKSDSGPLNLDGRIELGRSYYSDGPDRKIRGHNYASFSIGVVSGQGRLQFFSDIGCRTNFVSPDKEIRLGEKLIETEIVFPRMGFHVNW